MNKNNAQGEAQPQQSYSKEGRLIKEGGTVKSWKKRLFVLNDATLKYYAIKKNGRVITFPSTCTMFTNPNLRVLRRGQWPWLSVAKWLRSITKRKSTVSSCKHLTGRDTSNCTPNI